MSKELQFCNFCLYASIHDFSYIQWLVAVLAFVLLLGIFFELVQNQVFKLLSVCTLWNLSDDLFEVQACNPKSFLHLMIPACLRLRNLSGGSHS